MPTTQLLPVPRMQFFDSNGNPLAGGFLYSYAAGTSTPQSTYADESGTVPNTNPVTLDSGGWAEVWLDASLTYKFVLTDANNAQLWSVDNVYSVIPGTAITSLPQTWTALQTFRDLAIQGPFPATWPNSATNKLLIAGTDNTHSLGTNVIGRIYCGDGTGFYLGIAKRALGTDKDIARFTDDGKFIVSGGINPQINIGLTSDDGQQVNDVMLQVAVDQQLRIAAADNSSLADVILRNLQMTGTLGLYNGASLAGAGIGTIVALANITAQTSAISTTPLLSSAPAGMYELHYYLEVTTTGNAVNLQGVFGWTDDLGGGGRTLATANLDCSTATESTTALGLGKISFYQEAGHNITYASTLSGAIGSGQYSLHLRLVYLG